MYSVRDKIMINLHKTLDPTWEGNKLPPQDHISIKVIISEMLIDCFVLIDIIDKFTNLYNNLTTP